MKYLAIGDLAKSPASRDVRMFFSHPDFEFLNTGPGPDVSGMQRRSTSAILAQARKGDYELVVAGKTRAPYCNPRKSILRNAYNNAVSLLRHPNLWTGMGFPWAKLGGRLAVVDYSDSPIVDNSRFTALRHCACYFKRELPQNPSWSFLYTGAKVEDPSNVSRRPFYSDALRKLRPIPLGIDLSKNPFRWEAAIPKKADVFFAGNVDSYFSRMQGVKILEQLRKDGYRVDFPQSRLPQDEFMLRCAQAYLVWSPEGSGWDCFRHYEAGFAGSVPLMNAPTIFRYKPLPEGESALYYFIEGDDLGHKIRQALGNRERLVQMGLAARQHILQWHTTDAIGRYVVEETRRTALAGPE